MAKVVLNDLSTTLANSAASTINANNTVLETALEKTLSRDGAGPNQMEADFDLNNNDLLNAGVINTREIWADGIRLTPEAVVDTTNFASAAQGAKADTALQQDGETQADVVADGSYRLRYLLEGRVNLLMAKPSLSNGVNNSVALQTAVNSASVAKLPVYIPAHPLGFDWIISNQINIPADTRLIVDERARVVCTGNITLFRCTGSNSTFSGGGFGYIVHLGDGLILDTDQFDGIRFTNLWCDADTGSSDMFRITGSDTFIQDNRFGSNRTGYVIRIEKTPGHININNQIDRNHFGGTGRVLAVSTTDSPNRPEGWSFTNNKSVMTGGTIIHLESFLSGRIDNNMLDQGSNVVINLAASSPGIQGLSITGNYIASAFGSGASTGIAINTVASAHTINDVRISDNEITFSGYGIVGQDNMSRLLISGNSFSVITNTAIQGPADDWTLRDNTYEGVGKNLNITEGAGGGSITIDNEKFDSAALMDFPVISLTRSRWNIGRTFGKVLRKISSATASSPTTPMYISIPHGLMRQPDLVLGLTGRVANGAVYDDLRYFVVAVDATNVTIQIRFVTAVTPGDITFTIESIV